MTKGNSCMDKIAPFQTHARLWTVWSQSEIRSLGTEGCDDSAAAMLILVTRLLSFPFLPTITNEYGELMRPKPICLGDPQACSQFLLHQTSLKRKSTLNLNI